MSRSVFVTSFGAQSLNNGTTICQEYVIDEGSVNVGSLIFDVDHNLYDTAASAANDSRPGVVTVGILVNETTAANFVTTTNAILALKHTKATLTGTDANSGTITCDARCVDVRFETRAVAHANFWQRFQLVFNQAANWA